MKYILTILFVALAAAPAFAQSTDPGFYSRNDFLLAAPGTFAAGLYGYDNPAYLSRLRTFNLAAYWTGKYTVADIDRQAWGMFFDLPSLGFNFIDRKEGAYSVTDYNLSCAFGGAGGGLGFGYEWSTANFFHRPSRFKVGGWLAPGKRLSLGLAGNFDVSGSGREYYADLALRPLAGDRFTLFADYVLPYHGTLKVGGWSAGLCLELLPGVRLTGRYIYGGSTSLSGILDRAFTAGIYFSFGSLGAVSQAHFDSNNDFNHNTYSIRLGGYDRNIFRSFLRRRVNYLGLDLNGPLRYRRYAFFDKSQTLLGLLELIEKAKRDKTIAGIALNLSGMDIDPEMVWEVREKLSDFKAVGKRVVIYLDNAGMTEYHLASVADRIVIDPCGMINLTGTIRGRFYLKGTLDKLGIGIDEWRFFKYKSAAETFSRENMSEDDREQWQKLCDDYYALMRRDICQGRGLEPDKFDSLVDGKTFFMPADARGEGLVDTIGRWDAVENVIAGLESRKKAIVGPASLVAGREPWPGEWGRKPAIALIYALGPCEMDAGIKARDLVKVVEAATKDPRIKAVVFRVDSPGGDALASDIVAEALKKCRAKKPVIVTQGYVAGSGGYWLSMYGDTIVAAPNTITGSIGVIGYWLYNKELKQKLGVATDHVQDGAHADLGYGFTYPLLGMLPDRNLTPEERSRMEKIIKDYYRDFVAKVAAGRRTTVEAIEPVAQGRVWSGSDGREKGLVDVLGGLDDAIRIAKAKVGLSENHEVVIVELPKPELFNLNMFQPKLIGVDETQRAIIDLLRFYSRHNGQALTIMPMEMMLSVTALANYR
jgi:protease-4